MTLTEPEPTIVDAPNRSFPVVPVLAGALALSLVGIGLFAFHASGDSARIAVAACQSSLHTMALDPGKVTVAPGMTVRSLTEFASSRDAVRFDNDNQGSGSIDIASQTEVAELVAFYTERDSRESAQGLRSLVVTGQVSGNDLDQSVSCLVTLRGTDVVGQPGLWTGMF